MNRFPTRFVIGPAVLWLACLVVPGLSRAQEDDHAFAALSARRVAVLERLTRESMAAATGNVDERKLEQEILGRFAAAEPGCPTGTIAAPVIGQDTVAANTKRIVDDLVAKRFPPLDPEKLKSEAEAKYPIIKKGEMVEFFYSTNPEIMRRVTGVYKGRNDQMIQVGPRVLRIEDIARIPGNAELLLRFDPQASGELRKAYVDQKLAEHEAARNEYERQATLLALAKEREAAFQANEAEGYLWHDGSWTTASALVGALVGAERERLAEIARKEAAQRLARKRDAIAAAVDSQALHEADLAAAVYVDVDAELAAYKARTAAAAAAAAVEPVKPVEPTGEPVPAEEVAPVAEAPPATAPAAAAAATETATALVPVWAYAAAGAVVLLLAVGAVVMFARRSAGPGQDLKKFFQGRGKVQRTFWQMAEEKPETFKYVAYRYPTAQDARQALLQLSYVSERVGGDLVCRHDVYFGYGPHQDKFVCFVGGETLHYALWREASAVFPEYPGAEYFRVSTAPDVRLEIPDLEALLADPELQIEHVENREGEGTDYSQYYVYHAPAKENALEFLKHALIQEAGLHVVVLTPDGIFGKDENGIYEEPMELWTERYPQFFGA